MQCRFACWQSGREKLLFAAGKQQVFLFVKQLSLGRFGWEEKWVCWLINKKRENMFANYLQELFLYHHWEKMLASTGPHVWGWWKHGRKLFFLLQTNSHSNAHDSTLWDFTRPVLLRCLWVSVADLLAKHASQPWYGGSVSPRKYVQCSLGTNTIFIPHTNFINVHWIFPPRSPFANCYCSVPLSWHRCWENVSWENLGEAHLDDCFALSTVDGKGHQPHRMFIWVLN